MVAADSEAKAAAAEVADLVVVAAAAAMAAVAAMKTSKRSSPGSGTRCIANSNSKPCTSPCSRENSHLPHHCRGLSRTRIVHVWIAVVQQRPAVGLGPRKDAHAEVATQWLVAAAFGAQVVAEAAR